MPQMELWVFGYGSLMWRPGFPHERAVRARLDGYSRRFCVLSVHHRGTEARPGLVLGLDRGGICEGMAFKVPAAETAATLRYLTAREQVNGVYRAIRTPIELLEATPHDHVTALTYVVERAHPSYATGLSLGQQARLMRGAHGLAGDNVSYLVNTLEHLAQMSIREPQLERLRTVVGPVVARPRMPRAGANTNVSWRGRGIRAEPVKIRRLRPDQRRRFQHRMGGT